MSNVTIISSEKNWLEQDAVNQLKQTGKLPGVINAVGLPDLHPGKTPVGAVIITDGIIYPHLVGNDIGCGMAMFKTELEKKKIKIDRLIKKAEAMGSLQDIPFDESLYNVKASPLGQSLGTIGGGNHFAELQEVDTVFDQEAFKQLGYEKNQVMLLVHSGSRSYGQIILDESIRQHQAQNGLVLESQAAQDYIAKHEEAILWAGVNRELVALRLLKALSVSTDIVKLSDSPHNYLSIKHIGSKPLCIHRKGASPGDAGAVVIPGSRGSLTYLVLPTENTEISGFSLAHGAGRKWERSMCRSRLKNKYTKETIKYTKFKGKVICGDSNLLFEEAPEAYKNIDTVIQSMLDFGLINVIAAFKPILTIKK